MNKILALVYIAVAAVYSSPLVFNDDLVKNGNDTLSVLYSLSYKQGEVEAAANGVPVPSNSPVLRYLVLVPKLGKLGDLDGFASQPLGMSPKYHSFLSPSLNLGVLTDLSGFSDCVNWAGVLVGLWGPGGHFYHGHSLVKNNGVYNNQLYVSVDPLVAFVHSKVVLMPYKGLLAGLLKKGLPAQLLTHKLLEYNNLLSYL